MAVISKSGEKLINSFVSGGATLVLIGAWAKILHIPGASLALSIGMLTEAFIFGIYAYLGAKGYGLDDHGAKVPAKTEAPSGLLEKIGADQFTALQKNIAKMNEIATQLKDLSVSAGATSMYNEQITKSAKAFADFGNLVNQTVTSVSQFKKTTDAIANAFPASQVADMQNMATGIKNMAAFYASIAQATEALKESVNEAKNAKQQMNNLTQNLSQLNAMYGNMITAMRSGGAK